MTAFASAKESQAAFFCCLKYPAVWVVLMEAAGHAPCWRDALLPR